MGERQAKYTEGTMQNINLEQEIIHLSKEKWRWMSERNIYTLDALFHEKAVFVHMGGSWEKHRNLRLSGAVEFTISKQISMKCRWISLAQRPSS
jgi:hypothetical protein